MTRTWHDGIAVDLDDDAWAEVLPTCLGAGFRVAVLPEASSLAFARDQAALVASTLGTRLDEQPWRHLAGSHDAREVVGGWPHAVGGGFGEPWTRATPLQGSAVVGPARAVDLPWTYASDSPTAGLPMISTMHATRAEAHLRDVGADVGLWWNARGELCATTAGPPLLLLDGVWLRPGASSRSVPSWTHTELAALVGAEPAALGRDLVVRAQAWVAVAPRGELAVLAGDDADLEALTRAG